jgi:hypothetical protein
LISNIFNPKLYAIRQKYFNKSFPWIHVCNTCYKREPNQKHVCYRAANANRIKITFATAQQMQTEPKSRLLPCSKREPNQNHVCYRAANANRTKITFATAQQMQTEPKSRLLPRSKREPNQNHVCYRAASVKIFRWKNIYAKKAKGPKGVIRK